MNLKCSDQAALYTATLVRRQLGGADELNGDGAVGGPLMKALSMALNPF